MIVPATRYRDCEAALAFLTEVLGLDAHAVYRGDDGGIVHAQLTLGSGMVMFGPEGGGAFDAYMVAPAETGGRETTSVYLVVSDIDAHYARVTSGGAEILMPLEAQDYGGKNFTVRDPEGHFWSFGDYDPWAASG